MLICAKFSGLRYKGNYAGTHKRGLTNDRDAYNVQPEYGCRSFTLVDEFELSGRVLHVIYDSQTPRAAIIEADIETFDGVPRHRVVAALDLQHKAHLGKDIIAVERCWEDTRVVR